MKLRVATCQFPVRADIGGNRDWIVRQMRQARARGADVAHFGECALGGYAGESFESFKGYDWPLLERCTRDVQAEARRLRLWAMVGSNHRLTGRHKPHNSVYAINDRGDIVDRYDKRFCFGAGENDGDLRHYSPGSHFALFRIRGVPCSALICYDYRFPELYRELYRRGVRLVFHSYHNGDLSREQYRTTLRSWSVLTPAVMQAEAAMNHLWISAANTSGRESSWAAFLARPDGLLEGRLPRNRPGVLISTLDTTREYYDPGRWWRDRAVRGILHSGTIVKDKRSSCKNTL